MGCGRETEILPYNFENSNRYQEGEGPWNSKDHKTVAKINSGTCLCMNS